jgi:hypothetical protein
MSDEQKPVSPSDQVEARRLARLQESQADDREFVAQFAKAIEEPEKISERITAFLDRQYNRLKHADAEIAAILRDFQSDEFKDILAIQDDSRCIIALGSLSPEEREKLFAKYSEIQDIHGRKVTEARCFGDIAKKLALCLREQRNPGFMTITNRAILDFNEQLKWTHGVRYTDLGQHVP